MMPCDQNHPQKLKPGQKAGNSLTFLVTSLLVISASLAATTMALGPGFEAMVASHPIQEFMDQVGQTHLSQIESAVLANPQLFENNAWQGGAGSGVDNNTNVNLPNYQTMSTGTFNNLVNLTPAIPTTYTDNSMRVNNSAAPMNITSTLAPGDFLRLTTRPYDNMLYVKVRVQTGGLTLWRHKFITLNHHTAFRETNLVSNPTSTQAASNPIAPEPGESSTNNFQIRQVMGPFMQVGNERICRLPNNTTSALSCPVKVMNNSIRMLYGGQEAFTGSASANNIFYLWWDSNPDGLWWTNDAAYRLHLRAQFSNGSLYDTDSLPLPSTFSLNDPIYVQVFPPAANDALRHYKAVIVYRDDSTSPQEVYLTYARWDITGIRPRGVFDPSDIKKVTPFLGTSTQPSDDPNAWTASPTASGGDFRRVTYHPATRSIVAADRTTRQIYIRRLAPFNFVDANNDTIDDMLRPTYETPTLVTSTDPASMTGANPGIVLQTASSVDFRELWMSDDGQTVVAKTRLNTGAGDRMGVFAFKPNVPIGPNNSSTNLSGTPAENGNIAQIMIFNVDSPANEYDANLDTAGQTVDDSDELRLWYNSYTHKFYWLVYGGSGGAPQSSKFLYEWDPETWGLANTAATNWVADGTSLLKELTLKRVHGQTASASGANSTYTGTFRTVRKIAGAPAFTPTGFANTFGVPQNGALWTTDNSGNPVPVQVVYHPKTQTYYMADGNFIRAIDLKRGYRTSFQLANTNSRGRKLVINPQTGWLYYTASGNTTSTKGLWGFNPINGDHAQVINNINFSSGLRRGNGDLVYNPYTMQVYVLQFPAGGITADDRPQFVRYRPYGLEQDPTVPVSFTPQQFNNPSLNATWYQTTDPSDSTIYEWSEHAGSRPN